MTKSFCHFDTIPSDMMDIIEADLTDTFDEQMQTSRLMGNAEVLEKRNSTNAWVPTTYWIGGLIWHYFKRANDEFFHYDIIDISNFHYLHINEYDEENNSYDWHVDCNTYGSEEDLKLTCLLNISTEPYDEGRLYLSGLDEEGQELIFKDFNMPGYAIIFTANRMHKVEPITSGKRKTLSYWVRGPAWR